MGERSERDNQYLRGALSRRRLLQLGAAGAASAGLLARGGGASARSGPTLTAQRASFSGVSLQIWSGATTGPPTEQAAAEWSELTGGEAVVTVIPFAERALQFAGLVSAEDSSIDLLYIGGAFAGQFGDRLYDDLDALGVDTSDFVAATIPILTSDGALRGLPLHSEMELFIYNKTMFEAAGLDADNPPDTWDGLYEAAPELIDGDRYGAAVPWTVSYGSAPFYLAWYNSIPGAKFLSDDRNDLLFDTDDGLLAFQSIEAGMRANFFDPNLDATVEDYGVGTMFNSRQTASQINFAELWGYAVGGNPTDFPTELAPEEVGVSIVPGITSGTSGSFNGFEGYGISRFSENKEAALDFLMYLTGTDFQKQMNLALTLPSSRVTVLTDPDVAAVYPIGSVLAEQGTFNLDRYAAPYDWTPPVTEALVEMYRGDIGAEEAHQRSIEGVQSIIDLQS